MSLMLLKYASFSILLAYLSAFILAQVMSHSAIEPGIRIAEAVARATLIPIGLILFAFFVAGAISSSKLISAWNKVFLLIIVSTFVLVAGFLIFRFSIPLAKDLRSSTRNQLHAKVASVSGPRSFFGVRLLSQITFSEVPGVTYECIALPDSVKNGKMVSAIVLPNSRAIIKIKNL